MNENAAISEIDSILGKSPALVPQGNALDEIDNILGRNDTQRNALAEIDEILNEKKPGFLESAWDTTKAFGRDLAKVPSEFMQGAESTSDQIRMFGNWIQGDQEELESLFQKQRGYQTLPENETTVGGWVRGVANALPYTGMAAGGGVAGGAAGSLAGPAGTTVGAGLGAASVGFAQGWGEMYGRLRNEGIDHDTAAGIALAVAPVYAGIEAVQVKKLPGVGQLAEKYLAGPFKRALSTKLTDKAFRGKVQRALGEYAGEVIGQSAEEGAQEMALNAGEQYARNGGFGNFSAGENLRAGAEAFRESAGPFAVLQAPGVPLKMARRNRAQNIENVRNAVEEGRAVPEVPRGAKPGETFKGPDGAQYRNVDGVPVPVGNEAGAPPKSETSNLEEDIESDPVYNPPAAQNIPQGEYVKNEDGVWRDAATGAEVSPEAAAEMEKSLPKPQELKVVKPEAEEGALTYSPFAQMSAEQLDRLDAMARADSDAGGVNFALNPRDIDANVAKNINALREKIAIIRDNGLPADRESIFKNYGNELVPIAKLSDKAFEYYKKNYGAKSPYVYTSEAYAIDHHFNNHAETELSRYLALPDTIYDPHNVKDVSTERGAAQAFLKKSNDKWNLATVKPDLSVDGDGKIVFFKNFYKSSRPYKNKPDINFSMPDKNSGLRNSEGRYPFIAKTSFESHPGERYVSGVQESQSEANVPIDNRQSQGNIKHANGIRRVVNNIHAKFGRGAARKSNLDVFDTVEQARERTGNAEIPDNARAFQSGDRIAVIAGNIKDKNAAARAVLHEQVGHFGLRGLLGADLRPFLNYVIKHHKGGEAWNRIARTYEGAGDYAVAEEVLAHLAENREISDPSMWGRLVHRVKRALWDGGVPQEYVNLLDEDVLKSAIVLSRDWAKGDHYLNADGIWQRVGEAPKGRELPEDENMYSIELGDAQRFEQELQDYIDGKLDNRHVFRLGMTPEALRLVGARNLPMELTASVLATKEAKHGLNLEDLKSLPAELSDPIAIFQSSQVPNGLLVITEIRGSSGDRIAVAVHLDKSRNRNIINDIRSIHERSDFNIQTQTDRGLLLYLNTKRKPHFLRPNRVAPVGGSKSKTSNKISPLVQFHGRDLSKKVLYGGKIFTQDDLSQAEKDNIFELRGNNRNYRYSLNENKPDERAETKRQHDEVLTKYRGTPQWMKAPNGKPTNLTERQWVQVRTPNFKKWFGDWETAAIIQEIENMPAKDVKPHEALDKAGIKDVFRSFGEVENKRDGRTVVFPSASAGKIKYHKGFNSSSIIRSFKTLFESAIPAFSEKEILKDGHKQHRSYESYEHYVNKFTINGNEYFIRFTVPVIKNNPNSDNVHSTAVSEVAVYQNERASTVVSAFNNAESNVGISGKGGSSQFRDGKLADFLNSVKPESVSKVVDENGEPLVVYHRSQDSFNVFDRGKIGSASDWGALGRGFYFSPRDMIQYGGVKYSVFLNIKNPMILDRDNVGAIRDEVDADRGESFTKRIVEQGYDGVIYKDWEGIDEIVALESPQIKKAANRQELDFGKGMLDVPDTDNVGTFDAGNPDIRYSLTEQEQAQKRANTRDRITSSRARWAQAGIDAFAPLAEMERELYGKVRDASKSAWKMALMTKNLDAVMYHILEVGGIKYDKATGEFSYREGTEPLGKIFEAVKGAKYANFENYAKAKSALERLQKEKRFSNPTDALKFTGEEEFIRMFGFGKEDAKRWIKEGTADTKDAFGRLQKFFAAQREFMVETGLVSRKFADYLNSFQNYIPFFREGTDLDAKKEEAAQKAAAANPGGRGLSGRDSGVREFEGSSRKVKNLVENIVAQTRNLMDNGYKNVAMARACQLMRELGMATYLKQDTVEVKAKLEELKKRLEEQGYDVSEMSDEELRRKVPLEAFADLKDADEKLKDDIVAVRVNGNLAFYKVEDPELLAAVKNFGAEKFSAAWKLLTAPKNIMTRAITKLPQFAIRNFIRDTGSNSILFGGKTVAPYLAKVTKSAVETAFSDNYMKKVWATGAGGGYWYNPKPENVSKMFKPDSGVKRVGKYLLMPASKILRGYERILTASEQANRMAVYNKAKAAGASDMEAAFQAMDVLNFGMRGSGVWTGKNQWARASASILHSLIRITPFLNARIQGLYKLWRESGIQEGINGQRGDIGLKVRTREFVKGLSKAVLARGLGMAAFSVLYSVYANNSKDEDGEKWFEKLTPEDKLNYWHIYLGNNTILRIPKPFEIGYLFGTVPEAMTDALIQERPDVGKVLWRGLLSQLEFNPLANPVLDTVWEQNMNEDSFTHRAVVPRHAESLSPEFQYDADTSATAKAIAKVFSGFGLDETWLASPARVQNAMGNLLAGMTRYITAASDPVVEALTDIEGGTSRYARESVWKQTYSWATRNTRTMNTKNTEDFYELRQKAREIYQSARVLRQEARIDELNDLIDRNRGILGNYDFVEAANTRLAEISRERRSLGRNRSLSEDEIMRRDDELLAERNRLLASVDVLLERIESGEVDTRHMREIMKRIENAGKEKGESKKARRLLMELAR